MSAWEAALDSLEHDLAAFGAIVADLDHAPYTPTFMGSADLGPLPPELRERATELAEGYAAAVAEAEAQRTRLLDEMQRVSQVTGRPPAREAPGRHRIDFQG